MFEPSATDGVKCLDKCQHYNRARAPIFSDQAEFDELVTWAINTTTDPETKLYYKEGISATFWLAMT